MRPETADPRLAYGIAALPDGVRSRYLERVNGLRMHILESGYDAPQRPCVLLLHGFPELAYSWRNQLAPLAGAGYHAVAPDLRGYGRTTGWDADYDGDLDSFSLVNSVIDILALVEALGSPPVAAVVGHDAGSFLAAWCALIRPDVFRSVVMMSAPFGGPPSLNSGKANIDAQLAALPRPRKHYQTYYTTPGANDDMLRCPQGVEAFLRAYFHFKSADWPGNGPFPLAAFTAEELAKMPAYYIMDLDKGMAETVAAEAPSPGQIASCRWLTGKDLRVYSAEYARTGFQGGLQGYKVRRAGSRYMAALRVFSGRVIDAPSMFVAGASDWGVFQSPGAVENMRERVCARMTDFHLVEGAGHWVQQEQPDQVNRLLVDFLRRG